MWGCTDESPGRNRCSLTAISVSGWHGQKNVDCMDSGRLAQLRLFGLTNQSSICSDQMEELMLGEELARTSCLHECVQQTVKHGGGSVMTWGAISGHGVGPMKRVDGRMKAQDYIRLLGNSLLPFLGTLGGEYIFMDDNAPCHRARSVSRWMETKNVNRIEVWPAHKVLT